MPKSDGSLWHAFRGLWATERKGLPVEGRGRPGGWKDITTVRGCCQEPGEETLRAVVEFARPQPPSPEGSRTGSQKVTGTGTHTTANVRSPATT